MERIRIYSSIIFLAILRVIFCLIYIVLDGQTLASFTYQHRMEIENHQRNEGVPKRLQ